MESANPFDADSPRYAAVRPAYPTPALDALLARTEASLGRPARTGADIGAGTGKMTLLLADRGLDVTAVEPSAAMRRHMAHVLKTSGYLLQSDEIPTLSNTPGRPSSTGFPEAPSDASGQASVSAGASPVLDQFSSRTPASALSRPYVPARTHGQASVPAGASPVLDQSSPWTSAPASSTSHARAHAHAPTIRLLAASAEDTGLPDAATDLVVYAQSWHWVDPDAASTETARILAPSGTICAVWNQMDVSIPWIHRLTRIMRSGDVHRPDRPPAFGSSFTSPVLDVIPWEDTKTPEEILDLGTTRSSYLRQDRAGRARMQENLRWYLYEHLRFAPGEPVAIAYSTLVWTAERLG
ncbi:methyltransferase domain-containing protein [Actinomyces sp. B33]|uniref:class I SAM-dependent methyltransferase n=1 Tax=Actinomyces sp. B33 TaxID=2942131 RepID=UPI0023417692|nr:methyltransferase domain-containing protein [Actinomyces sp. B33]MDC4233897.1 methyltransferase domain-containing protein [Actinomyces sp. B33]